MTYYMTRVTFTCGHFLRECESQYRASPIWHKTENLCVKCNQIKKIINY